MPLSLLTYFTAAGLAYAVVVPHAVTLLHFVIVKAVSHQIFKHEEQFIVFSYDLLEFDYTGVTQLAQALDLPQRHTLLPAEELTLHFLDGNLDRTQCVIAMQLAESAVHCRLLVH